MAAWRSSYKEHFLIRSSSTDFLIYHAINDWEFDIKAFYRWTNMSLKCTLKRTTFINYPLFTEKPVHKRASMMIDCADCEWEEKWQTAKLSLLFSRSRTRSNKINQLAHSTINGLLNSHFSSRRIFFSVHQCVCVFVCNYYETFFFIHH